MNKHLFKPRYIAIASIALLGAALVAPAHADKTLDAIKARGQVICGVSTGVNGFSAADSTGKWTGLDVDVCRGLAAATLGDAESQICAPELATVFYRPAVG